MDAMRRLSYSTTENSEQKELIHCLLNRVVGRNLAWKIANEPFMHTGQAEIGTTMDGQQTATDNW